MAGRRLRCSAPGLWDNLSRSPAGLGELPNKHFCGPCALQKFRSVATPELLAKTRNPQHGAKNGGYAFLRILRFSGFLNTLGCGFYHDKLFFIHRI
ncbi:hypothetical protein B5782_1027 [Bifidobacterium catenulatum]|uniref:Uncharacterized protein n=1 Tax=Bifidobacterium catenulatum TaxID=1686 RepID=A0A1V8PQR9_9BIFI|nr:hypothetical protein BKAS_1234 [Bifidobacterium catenulatum subsp. kashiwanohense JCM 15439 = DSM 21854]OQM51078.1 hypothetical protein B5782_1027 [Bifidobacterium catenulatum]